MTEQLPGYDDWKGAAPDDEWVAYDAWEAREAAEEEAADRWVNER